MKITEDYVSFETAKLLKEKGFDCPSYSHYRLSNGELFHFNTNCSTNLKQNDYITAPTLQMVVKWLREVHKCYITFTWEFKEYNKNYKPVYKDITWSFNIAIPKYNSARKGDGDYFDLDSDKEYDSYEQACEEAIKYCLKNLI